MGNVSVRVVGLLAETRDDFLLLVRAEKTSRSDSIASLIQVSEYLSIYSLIDLSITYNSMPRNPILVTNAPISPIAASSLNVVFFRALDLFWSGHGSENPFQAHTFAQPSVHP